MEFFHLIVSPFEQATRMVSQDEVRISDTALSVFILEPTLHSVIDWALNAQQQQEEVNFLLSQSCEAEASGGKGGVQEK